MNKIINKITGLVLLVFAATIIGLAFYVHNIGYEAMVMFTCLILLIIISFVILMVGVYFITYKEKDEDNEWI